MGLTTLQHCATRGFVKMRMRGVYYFDVDLDVSTVLLAGLKAELEALDLSATLTLTFSLTSIGTVGEFLGNPKPSLGTGTHCHSLLSKYHLGDSKDA